MRRGLGDGLRLAFRRQQRGRRDDDGGERARRYPAVSGDSILFLASDRAGRGDRMKSKIEKMFTIPGYRYCT